MTSIAATSCYDNVVVVAGVIVAGVVVIIVVIVVVIVVRLRLGLRVEELAADKTTRSE